MTESSKFVMATEANGGRGRELVWAPARREDQRAYRSLVDLRGAQQNRAELTRATADARAALREAAFAAATAAARARSVAEVLDEALAVLADAETAVAGERSFAGNAPHEDVALSPREQEVLALVAEGRSNKAIAAALFVSPNTIKTHVASLLHKFHAGSRVQLAAMVAGQAFR